MFIGVNNLARKIKNCYVGVDGKARKVKAVYVGVNGVARLVWRSIKKIVSTYTSVNKSTTPMKLWNYLYSYSTKDKRKADISSYKQSDFTPSCVICDTITAKMDTTVNRNIYSRSIQKLIIDNNYNLTENGRISYDFSTEGSGGTWCGFYNDIDNYVFMYLETRNGSTLTRSYYSVRDWSNNEICALDFSRKYSLENVQSGVLFSNSKFIVCTSSTDGIRIGVIKFNGTSLTQNYYTPQYIDKNGNYHVLSPKNNNIVQIQKMENNVGLIAFQGRTADYLEEAYGGTVMVAFKLNDDDTITFGKTIYVQEGYSGYEETTTGILLTIGQHHAVVYDNYVYLGNYGNTYSLKWFAIYIDDNLNITITDRYEFYDKNGFEHNKSYGTFKIGKTDTFGVLDGNSNNAATLGYGVYLYTLDTTTNKIVKLTDKLFPTSGINYGLGIPFNDNQVLTLNQSTIYIEYRELSVSISTFE